MKKLVTELCKILLTAPCQVLITKSCKKVLDFCNGITAPLRTRFPPIRN